MRSIYIYNICFFVFTIFSCEQGAKFNRPDVSRVDLQVEIERFDQKLSQLQVGDILTFNTVYQDSYPFFYTDYMIEILGVGHPSDSLLVQDVLGKVIQKKDFIDLSTSVSKIFPDLKKQENELTQAFKYVKHYYPEYKMPKIIAFVGGFSYQTPVGEDYIGIGLDMFLGADSEFYPALVNSIPLYVSRRFTPENISPRVIETVLREEIMPQSSASLNTLQHMIYNGKILYALDVLLEQASDETKIGYSIQQLEWAKKYQREIWAWFLKENLLYNTDYNRIQKYFTEAPFTPELGDNNESAPKLGSYIGWMIVRKYMERHPEVSLRQLLELNDAQQILEDSKFKG